MNRDEEWLDRGYLWRVAFLERAVFLKEEKNMTHPFIIWYSQFYGVTASLWINAWSNALRYPQQRGKQRDK